MLGFEYRMFSHIFLTYGFGYLERGLVFMWPRSVKLFLLLNWLGFLCRPSNFSSIKGQLQTTR